MTSCGSWKKMAQHLHLCSTRPFNFSLACCCSTSCALHLQRCALSVGQGISNIQLERCNRYPHTHTHAVVSSHYTWELNLCLLVLALQAHFPLTILDQLSENAAWVLQHVHRQMPCSSFQRNMCKMKTQNNGFQYTFSFSTPL